MDHNVLNNLNVLEKNISAIASKVYLWRNENNALRKRIAQLEKENTQLRSKRDYTCARLKKLMQKFQEYDIEWKEALLIFAKEYGYCEHQQGYLSKCHLCVDIRKYLSNKNEFIELEPKEFCLHLE